MEHRPFVKKNSKVTVENNYKQHSRELGRIGMWLYEFAKTDNDSTYLLFLRLLADYRHLQAQNMDDAVDRQEKREWDDQSGDATEMVKEVHE